MDIDFHEISITFLKKIQSTFFKKSEGLREWEWVNFQKRWAGERKVEQSGLRHDLC